MTPPDFDRAPTEFESDLIVLKDVSALLPRNASKHYRQRDASSIDEVIIHQTQGSTKPTPREALINEGEFFIGDDDPATPDVEGRGWPGFAYTFWVPFRPELTNRSVPIVYRCQPDEVLSYHTRGRNLLGVGIAFQGLFRSRTAPDSGHPSSLQNQAFRALINYACSRYRITPLDVFTHSDFGKEDCPGYDLEDRVSMLRGDYLRGNPLQFDDWRSRQQALAAAGFLLASEVDGEYGPKTRRAVERIQGAHGYPMTGLWSRPVDTFIRRLVAEQKEVRA